MRRDPVVSKLSSTEAFEDLRGAMIIAGERVSILEG
jgi:hypothetical protein